MSHADTLVIGLGSIGERHVRVLRNMGRAVSTVSRRGEGDYADLAAALAANAPDYVVVASETTAHADTLAALAGSDFRGRVLVEKPLLARPAALPAHAFAGLFVGYNLRFHPLLQQLSALLAGKGALAAAAYVGQYLPDWRPGRDYRATASARAALGGGVLRDLSHELDYLLWLFGPWRRVAAISLKSRELDVETEDTAAILMECERCPAVTIQLNYHHRPVERRLTVATAEHGLAADLVAGTLTVDGHLEILASGRDDTYTAMHRAVLEGGAGACAAQDGVAVVELVEAIEKAAAERRWIER